MADNGITELAATSHDMATPGLTESEQVQARAYAAELVEGDLQAIHGFGRDLGAHTAAETDNVLAQVKATDVEMIGGKLGQIVAAAQNLNLRALSGARSRIPLVGGYIDKLRFKKNDFVRQFQDVRTQVDGLVAEVDTMQRGLAERIDSLEDSFESVRQEHKLLGIHVAAGEMALVGIRDRVARSDAGPDGEVQAWVESELALEKRVADLRMLQHAALQQLPMIRMVQTNNRMLIEKFHTVKELTVPAWKRQFMLAISLNEQRNAVRLAYTIDNATNAFLRENARLLKENTISTAEANQRMVIDIETLRDVHDSLMSTVQEVIRINREGAQQRIGISAELESMRQTLANRLGNN